MLSSASEVWKETAEVAVVPRIVRPTKVWFEAVMLSSSSVVPVDVRIVGGRIVKRSGSLRSSRERPTKVRPALLTPTVAVTVCVPSRSTMTSPTLAEALVIAWATVRRARSGLSPSWSSLAE